MDAGGHRPRRPTGPHHLTAEGQSRRPRTCRSTGPSTAPWFPSCDFHGQDRWWRAARVDTHRERVRLLSGSTNTAPAAFIRRPDGESLFGPLPFSRWLSWGGLYCNVFRLYQPNFLLKSFAKATHYLLSSSLEQFPGTIIVKNLTLKQEADYTIHHIITSFQFMYYKWQIISYILIKLPLWGALSPSVVVQPIYIYISIFVADGGRPSSHSLYILYNNI